MDFDAVILAGGESRRMGRDKAWIELNGHPQISRAVETVRRVGAGTIFISGRAGTDYSSLGCPVLVDLEPGFGPLGGIERGLAATRASLLLVLAVDLPRMTAAFLQKLLRRGDPLTGVIPKLGDGFEPLAAIYPRRCHAIIVQFMQEERHSARDFSATCLRERAVREYRVSRSDAGCFFNCNSPADFTGTRGNFAALDGPD